MIIDIQNISKELTNGQSDDWTLICFLTHYSYKIENLVSHEYAELYDHIWSETDAYTVYGKEIGYIPPQGYDWSGIRDSSHAAIRRMAKKAKDYLLSINKKTLVVQKI